MTLREIIEQLVESHPGGGDEFRAAEELRKEWVRHLDRVKRVEDNLTDTTWLAPESLGQQKRRKIAIRFNTEHAGSGYNWRVFVYEKDGSSKQIIAKELSIETGMYTETFLNDQGVLKGNIFAWGWIRAGLDGTPDQELPDKTHMVEIFGHQGPLVHEEDLKGWIDDADFKKDELQAKLELSYYRASTGKFNAPEDPS